MNKNTAKVRIWRTTRCLFLAMGALLMVVPSVATPADDGDTLRVEKKPKGVMRLIYGIKNFMDSSAVRGLDKNFIEAPQRPWQVILKGNVNQSDLRMEATIDGAGLIGEGASDLLWAPRIKTVPSTYVGLWAGYRGYGFGYMKNIGGDNGTYLTLGATGGSYGVNFRSHKFDTSEPIIRFKGQLTDEPFDITEKANLDEPIDVHTIFADAYYLFNGKHFSYAAAYDQSVIQRRSAGSLMVGATFYHINIDYAKHKNAPFINLMNDIGRFKQWQAGVGIGYAYNLVPCRGLLISVMAMPVLVFYNRSTSYHYDSNFNEIVDLEDLLSDDDSYMDKVKITPTGKDSQNNHMVLNYDARLSMVYNWKNMFLNVSGQYNYFHYEKQSYSGRLYDWFINASVGIRL